MAIFDKCYLKLIYQITREGKAVQHPTDLRYMKHSMELVWNKNQRATKQAWLVRDFKYCSSICWVIDQICFYHLLGIFLVNLNPTPLSTCLFEGGKFMKMHFPKVKRPSACRSSKRWPTSIPRVLPISNGVKASLVLGSLPEFLGCLMRSVSKWWKPKHEMRIYILGFSKLQQHVRPILRQHGFHQGGWSKQWSIN